MTSNIIPVGKKIVEKICGYVSDRDINSLYKEFKEKYIGYKITHEINNGICIFTIENDTKGNSN